MKIRALYLLLFTTVFLGCSEQSDKQTSISSKEGMDRTILPIQPPLLEPVTEMDARNVTKPDIFVVKPPEGAPNIVIVMIDDIGFGATSTFGGAIEAPTLIMDCGLIAFIQRLYAHQHVPLC